MTYYSEHFSIEELTCRCGCGNYEMLPEFMDKLEEFRVLYNKPILVTSAKRCENWNMKVGGKPDSQHLTGNAVDISVFDEQKRYQIIRCAIEVGFPGIGVNKGFIHLDLRNENSKVFLY